MSGFDIPSPLLPEILQLHGYWRGGREAVVCGSERLSWREFMAGVNRFANALLQHGVQKGDCVAVLMSNSAEMVQALFGIMVSGATSVPINLSVNDDAVQGMIADSSSVGLIASGDQAARVDGLRGRLPDTMLYVCDDVRPGWLSLADFQRGATAQAPGVHIEPDDFLNVIYSSGTTGLPKGIVHTHRGRRHWAADLAIALRYHGAARTLLTIGLYSNISWVAMLSTVLGGGTLLVHRRFDPRAFLDTVAQERITHTAMVPIQFQRVVEAMTEGDDVTSLQAMMSCGSPLHVVLKKQIFERFPCGIIELYGLTEGIIATMEPEEAPGRWASVGKPLLGSDIRIIDDDDRELPPGIAGELVSRSALAMPHYLNRPEATQEATWVDGSGRRWLRSGDIGYRDEEGFLYIVDRKKDMILSGGQNIYPQDIEAVLIAHEAVDDVAVIGLPSERWGETPVALVVLHPGSDVDCESLVHWANSRLGRQQRLADVITVSDLPRNPNGKILKRELRGSFGGRIYP